MGSSMARGLAKAGARVGILGRREEAAANIVGTITGTRGEAIPLQADVLNQSQLGFFNFLPASDAMVNNNNDMHPRTSRKRLC